MTRPLALLPLCGACLPDISHTLDPGPPPSEPPVVVVVDTADTGTAPLPVAEITMDATDYELWVGLDLDTFDPAADPEGTTWDLRFRRFEVALDGGVSGSGGVEVTALDEVPFDEVLQVAAGALFVTDEPDADGDGVPEYALADWYLYDEATHRLDPAPRTYVVRTTDDALYRLAFEAYYDENGTPARIALRTGPLTHPEE
jgi:hypothetical protein